MGDMTKSARVLRLEELLRDAKPYVGRCASAGAQELSAAITKYFAERHQRSEPTKQEAAHG
ncbi:hypothetical protein B6S59_25255 [Pseudomonas sp. A46]|nr:hypothetical protein B6S59_25255 [Pseudomonas sp. A46]